MKTRKFVIPEQFRKAGTGLKFFVIFELMIKGFEILLSKLCEDKIIAFLLMVLFSFVLRYLIIIIYDHVEEDWFLIEYFKQKIQKKEEVKKLTSTTRKMLILGENGNKLLIWLIFLNPVITVIYYREGHHKWNGVPLKIFKLFVLSEFSCTIVIAGLIYLISILINLIF